MDWVNCLDSLVESQLLSDEHMVTVRRRFARDEEPSSVIESLVSEGVLTRYQARQLSQGKARDLNLGQYRILDRLGRGGNGEVYKAIHRIMNRVVAVKVIAPELVEDEQVRSWFRREVLASTELYHPNLVMAYDANEVDALLFLVMEFIDGPTLHDLVHQQGPLPIALGCEMLRQTGLALQYAHDKGMVHRDVKPSNLLIPRQALAAYASGAPGSVPLVKVADFGLARLHRSAPGGTLMLQNEKSFVGTPDYVSPEQAQNIHGVDIRSDLYSLGCTFYYALTGQKPFKGTTALEVVLKHLKDPPPPVETCRPEVPPRVAAIIRRLLAKNPDQRFQTPAELVAELTFVCGLELAQFRAGGTLPEPSAPARPKTPDVSEPTPQTTVRPTPVAWRNPSPTPAPMTPRPAAPVPAPARAEGEAAHLPATIVSSMDIPLPPESAPASSPGREPAASVLAPPVVAPEEPAHLPEGPTPPSLPLKNHWRQWSAVARALASGHKSYQVDAQLYRTLYNQLLQLCRAEQAHAQGTLKDVLRRLESLVEPWVKPSTLVQTDAATRNSLLQRCREMDLDLGTLGGKTSVWLWAGLLALAGAAGGLALLLIR